MPDREKIIAAMEWCMENPCKGCPYEQSQDAEGRCSISDDTIVLLKKQEAVKPVLDKQTGRIWLCGKCDSYVGFEDNDPHDPNEFDRFCRDCGTPVMWEGR